MPVVGMEPVAAPRVVAEDDVGAQAPDPVGDLTALGEPVLQLAVVPAEEHDVLRATQDTSRVPLLGLPGGHEVREVGVGVPRPLRAVGADEVEDRAALRRPLGERAAATELHVVGVGGDGERAPRHREVEGEDGHAGGRRWYDEISVMSTTATTIPKAAWRPRLPLPEATIVLAMAATSPKAHRTMSTTCCQRGSRVHPVAEPSGRSGPVLTRRRPAGPQGRRRRGRGAVRGPRAGRDPGGAPRRRAAGTNPARRRT